MITDIGSKDLEEMHLILLDGLSNELKNIQYENISIGKSVLSSLISYSI